MSKVDHETAEALLWLFTAAPGARGFRDSRSKPARAETPKSGSVGDESGGAEGNRPND